MHNVRRVLVKPTSPRIGSARLLQRSSVDLAKLLGLSVIGIWMMPDALPAEEQPTLLHYEIVGDAIPDSLTATKATPQSAAKLLLVAKARASSVTRGPSPRKAPRATLDLTWPALDPAYRKASSGFAL